MLPLEFLAVVLPSAGHGHYCVAELSTPKKSHVFKTTLGDLQPTLDKFNSVPYDTYVAMATFEEPGKRIAKNARFLRSLFIDIDCNHKLDIPDAEGNIAPREYPSAKAAVHAIDKFLEDSGLGELGQPWLASSGAGVHAYWPLSDDVSVEDWKPIAENFKSLCKQYGLEIDFTVTADAARVMRVIDTTNTGTKGIKKVRGVTRSKLVSQGDIFDLDDLAKAIRTKLVAPSFETKQALMLPGARPNAAKSSTALKLFADSKTSFKKILNASVQGTGCGQLVYYMENATKDGLEPLWRGLLSWAKCCEDDGLKYAQRLSDMHPYEPERMQQKWQEIKGPYPCLKMDGENPGICSSCPHFGKITNPLGLGRVVEFDTTEKEISLAPREVQPEYHDESSVDEELDAYYEAEDSEAAAAPTVTRPSAPRGFGYGRTGGVYMERSDEDADGKTTTKQIMLLPFDLFVVRLLKANNEHTVHMIYDRKEGPQEIMLPQKAVVSKDETVKSLASQNVIAQFGAGNDKNLFEYVRACVNEASTNQQAVKVPDHCGWQEDNSYVHNYKVFRPHKKTVSMPMQGMENVNHGMNAYGTMEQWQKFMNMLIAKEMYEVLTIFLCSASAPLMRFTGINGLTYHFTSRGSGTGKSLGLDAGASLWGSPLGYRVSRDTSPVAFQQRLGLLHSSPLITDEITQKNRNAEMEWLPSFLFDMAEGKGKERMEAGSNRERINTTYWRTVALLTSNNPAVDYLTGTRAHSSEGELRRLLELTMETQLSWTPDEVTIIKSLADNCGHAAPVFIQYMVDNFDKVRELTNLTTARMYKELEATNDERYWMAGVGTAMAAGILLGPKHTNVVNLPLRNILEVFRGMVDNMREHTRKSQRAATDILNMFVRENYGKMVNVVYLDHKIQVLANGLDASTDNDLAENKSMTRTVVMGRVERGVTVGMTDFYIEERVMRAFCSGKSFGYSDFKRQIEKVYPTKYCRKNLTAKTDGPDMRVQAICISQPQSDAQADADADALDNAD